MRVTVDPISFNYLRIFNFVGGAQKVEKDYALLSLEESILKDKYFQLVSQSEAQ